MKYQRWPKIDVIPCLEEFLEYRKSISVSRTIPPGYRMWLYAYGSFVPDVLSAKRSDIRRFLTYLSQERQLQPSTQGLALKILKSFYSFAVDEGTVTENPCRGIPPVRVPLRIPHVLNERDLANARKPVRRISQFVALRDELLVEFLYATGLRRNETVGVRVSDINFADNSVRVIGKGNKERRVYFTPACAALLRRYIDIRPQTIGGHLFVTQTGRQITHWTVNLVVKNIFSRHGIHGSAHTLRRTYATTLYKNGMDIYKIQKLLGHGDISTTQRYVAVVQDDIRNSYEQAMG